MPSPIPISLVGSFIVFAIETIIPPFGVPSNFVIARAVISTASLNTLA